MILPLLFVPVVYGISSSPDVCALPPEPDWTGSNTCAAPTTNPETGKTKQTCCWTETARIPGQLPSATTTVNYCQTCYTNPDKIGDIDCQPPVQQITAPTPRGPFVLPEDGVLQQPTPPPTSPFTPLGEGTIQEPQTTPTPTPTPTPEDDQSDDGPGPFTGPLGGGVLQEPDDEPKDNGDNEEQEESSNEDEGSDTAGPLT